MVCIFHYNKVNLTSTNVLFPIIPSLLTLKYFVCPHYVEKNYNKSMSLNLLHYLWNKTGERVLQYGIITIPVNKKGIIVYTHQYNSENGWNKFDPMTN